MKLCESCGACFDDNYDLCGFDGGLLTQLFAGPRVIGGRYLLEQRVAAGAMGVVVRATHLQVGSTVAVKLMRPEKNDTHVALARFQREAQILGQIKHPNAVLVIDFGVEQRGADEQPYLVMEYLRGESLLSVLDKKGRLTLEELERIIVPLCEAVEEAHAVGVIHRDIKPGNVVLEKLRDGSEIVKVLDFGIARFVASGKRAKAAPAPVSLDAPAGEDDLEDELADLLADDDDFLDEGVATRAAAAPATVAERARATPAVKVNGAADDRGDGDGGDGGDEGDDRAPPGSLGDTPRPPGSARPAPDGGAGGLRDPTSEAGFMVGTIPYMAPEQMTGERVSVRTDVHAVAVLAFQCLAGKLPYDGDDEDIIAAKLSDERPSLADVGIDVPHDVDEVLVRAFALDPAERPATVRELADAVRSGVASLRAQAAARAALPLPRTGTPGTRGASVGGGAIVGGGADDPVTTAVVQIAAIGRSLALVESATRAWVDAAPGEEHYAKARDVLLAVDAPLRRVRTALEAAEPPLPKDAKDPLADARATLEAQVSAVRRSLARVEPKGGVGAEYGDYLAALWSRLDLTAQEILDGLGALLEDEKTVDTGPMLPAQLFAAAGAPRARTLDELSDRLLARDPLDSVDALDELLTSSVDQVVRAFGPERDEAAAAKLARGLWRHADALLLHELSPLRRTFRLLPFLAAQRDVPAAAPFALLARVLGRPAPTDDELTDALGSLERAEDRTVLARCLLAHPSERARTLAVARLDLSELWSVIAHPSTPIALQSFLFSHVVATAPAEYLKIFFFCVRESVRAAAAPADVAEALKLLARFFHVPCFHEDIVFEPLLEVDRTLRQRAAGLADKLAGIVDEGSYAEALASFTAGGVHETKPLEQMRDVPLAIQRKLAREGHFLTYFVSHSNDRVARETLPHLFRLDDITPFLRIATIHRIVLLELAKRRRFFRKDPPKLALLQNPKTPAIVARVFLPLVSQEQLRLLATNKHINPDVRRLVTVTLARGFAD